MSAHTNTNILLLITDIGSNQTHGSDKSWENIVALFLGDTQKCLQHSL